jgi:hypothetical protein
MRVTAGQTASDLDTIGSLVAIPSSLKLDLEIPILGRGLGHTFWHRSHLLIDRDHQGTRFQLAATRYE